MARYDHIKRRSHWKKSANLADSHAATRRLSKREAYFVAPKKFVN